MFGTAQGHGAILTFLAVHPQTQSLWLTDIRPIIAVIFIIAGHQYHQL